MCHANVLGLPQRKVLHLQGIFFCQRQLDQRCSVLLGLGFGFFFFLSQQFSLEKCHFDETEIAQEILLILTIVLGRELGRNVLKVLELPVMTFSEWKGVLIYFFFSFQNDVSECAVPREGKERKSRV